MEQVAERSRRIVMSDKEIVNGILSGEKQLYEILLRRNNQLLYRVIRGYIGKEDDVEDIMQETYILAYQKIHQFRGDAAFSTWLIRIGINESLKHLRKQKKTMDKPFEKDITDTIAGHNRMNPEAVTINFETGQAIDKAIDQLPPKYRSVFVMYEVEGLSMSEVSQALDITISNVKVRLHRAKNLLKDTLKDPTAIEGAYLYGAKHCDTMTENVLKKIMKLPTPSSETTEKPAEKSFLKRISLKQLFYF